MWLLVLIDVGIWMVGSMGTESVVLVERRGREVEGGTAGRIGVDARGRAGSHWEPIN